MKNDYLQIGRANDTLNHEEQMHILGTKVTVPWNIY